MSLASSVIDALVAAGCTAEQLAAAMKAANADADARAIEKRAKDAERQRKSRINRGLSQDVTVTECDNADVTNSTPSLSPPNDIYLTPPIPTPVNILPVRKGIDFPMLDCTDSVTWRDFLKNRKAKTLQNTPTAHKRLVKDLAEMAARTGWPPGKVFEACVAKGWGAIYDPRDIENGNNGRNKNNPSRNGRQVDGFAAALRQVADGSFDEPFAINR